MREWGCGEAGTRKARASHSSGMRGPSPDGYARKSAASGAAGPEAVQRPLISEPTTFSLSAFGPRVSATEPERTSSMMP